MRRAVLGALAALALTALGAGPARADVLGGLLVYPGASIDLASIHVRTTGGCPMPADAFYATVHGFGFPAAGQVVTANTSAGMSHTAGFDVYFKETLRDFAADNKTTLHGRYDITVLCIDSFTQRDYGDFAGSFEFVSDTGYRAIGTALPTAPSTPAGPGPTLTAGLPPPAPAGPGPAGSGPADTSVGSAPAAAAPAPRQPALASQSRPTDLGWPVLIGFVLAALAGVALVAYRAGRRRQDPGDTP